MKNIYISVVLLASLILGACSSDGDSDGDIKNTVYTVTSQSEAPEWQINWNYNQESPDWTEFDEHFSEIYGNFTTLTLQIEEALQPFMSQDDKMAIFVNGELRGRAEPAIIVGSEQPYSTKFVMKVWGNETGTETVNITLQYYNANLKHIFTLSDKISLNSDESIGTDEDYIPPFTLGSAKYPVVKKVNVETILTTAGITLVQNNMVGAFVGEECRGLVTLSASGSTQLIIYGRNAGESVTLKYYDAAKGKLYSIADAVKM